MTTKPCRYCGTLNYFTDACNGCWEVTSRIDFFVLSDAGLVRVLEAITKRMEIHVEATPLTEAVALGTSGQAGSTGQLLAAELLATRRMLERVRSELREVERLQATLGKP